ncbi:acyl carrier protein [Streptomyces sp. NPDC096324]|uniref:acyl carrier protein n=1 Tax=Streptomyces sp. NPDC096324 TaxID=3366085 RepID=UPI003822950E
MKATPHTADATPHPTDATPRPPDAAQVLADIAGLLTRLLEDEYGLDDVEIGMATTFNRDLELESIDLVTLSGLLEERYGGRVNFAEFLAGMEFDEIIGLTVGQLVAYVVTSLKAAEAS